MAGRLTEALCTKTHLPDRGIEHTKAHLSNIGTEHTLTHLSDRGIERLKPGQYENSSYCSALIDALRILMRLVWPSCCSAATTAAPDMLCQDRLEDNSRVLHDVSLKDCWSQHVTSKAGSNLA